MGDAAGGEWGESGDDEAVGVGKGVMCGGGGESGGCAGWGGGVG